MDYSQRPLIELMKQGNVPGEAGVPRHIETVISNVFLFPERAYKVYKRDNAFFNASFRDISGKAARFDFTRKDFAWNRALSPSIYLEIKGVSLRGGSVTVGEPADDADELMFVMNRIEAKDVLFERLMKGSVTTEDAYIIGRQLAADLQSVRVEPVTGVNYFELFERELEDLRAWIQGLSGADIPQEEWTAWLAYLERFRTEHQAWYEGELSSQVAQSGDMHSQNAIFTEGVFSLMDTYPPKEDWKLAHELTMFYRIGADIWALGSRELFESYRLGYEQSINQKVDRRLEEPLVVYSAAIMMAYLYSLQKSDASKKDAAAKYHAFLRAYFRSVA